MSTYPKEAYILTSTTLDWANPLSDEYKETWRYFGDTINLGELVTFYSWGHRAQRCKSAVRIGSIWLQENVFDLRYVVVRGQMRDEVGFIAWGYVLTGLKNEEGTNWVELERLIRKQIELWFPIAAEHKHSEQIRKGTGLPGAVCTLITANLFNVPDNSRYSARGDFY